MSKKYLFILFCLYSLNCQETKLEANSFSSETIQGFELAYPAKITKIGFSHSSTDPSDYLLGVFQGANDKTFFDAFPIYMITEEIEPDQLNLIDINCPQRFKYIRYLGPEGESPSISEFEIYGDVESFESSENEHYYQPTNLPLLVINSENSQMPGGKDKETKVKINAVIVNEGNVNVKQTGTIKLRGNSSINSEKKPYLIKFDEKTTFLDMPCNDKRWVLIPNMYDKSLLRNFLGYKMSSIFGLKFTPTCKYVDLILNGNFRGNYLICDKVEVKSDRVGITKMDETCNQEPEISGGYLLQATGSKRKESSESFKTTKGITLSYEYPDAEDITEAQKEYITSKINEIEAKIYENNVEDIDLDSFVRYFLVEDFSANQDGIFNSVFFYKERGDNKIYFGPVWDFDLAFDNAMVLYPTNEKTNFAFKFALSNGSSQDLVSQILSNDEILLKIKDTWIEMTNTVFTKEIIIRFLNKQIEYLNESQKLNYMKWDVLSSRQFMEAVCRGTYEAEVEYLKEFVEKRFEVFGEILNSATKESVLEKTKRSWGNWGDNPWGGNNPWGRNNEKNIGNN